jgi:hypothetical protein
MMSKLEKQLKALLKVGDVELYKTMDGGYGCGIDFYDNSYRLSHPADTLKDAVNEMSNEWRVKYQLAKPDAYHRLMYQKKIDELADYEVEDPNPKQYKVKGDKK